jgi:2-amino-4-hydroxy-6-hydroxymethyldihydropteridine diphosphokinase
MEEVLIGFGSNQGDSVRTCTRAIELLGNHGEIEGLVASSLYRTQPVGMVDQSWFVNGAIRCGTSLGPQDLLIVLQGIERKFGRVREIRWGPRTLDLDILAFGERKVQLAELEIPHPRLHERRFVLLPLMEIAPDWRHPLLGASPSEMLARLADEDQKVERLETQ